MVAAAASTTAIDESSNPLNCKQKGCVTLVDKKNNNKNLTDFSRLSIYCTLLLSRVFKKKTIFVLHQLNGLVQLSLFTLQQQQATRTGSGCRLAETIDSRVGGIINIVRAQINFDENLC